MSFISTAPFEPVVQHLPWDDVKTIALYNAANHVLHPFFAETRATVPYAVSDAPPADAFLSYYRLHELHTAPQLLQKILKQYPTGLIITPSPLIEVMEGVQPAMNPRTKGFILSRFFVWCDPEQGSICFLPKYETVIDNCSINSDLKQQMDALLLKEPVSVNTYCFWSPTVRPTVRVFKQGEDFDLINNPESYVALLNSAFYQHSLHAQAWVQQLPNSLETIVEES